MIQLLIPAEENEYLIKQICEQNNYEIRESEEAGALAEFVVSIVFSSLQIILQCVQIMQQQKQLKDERATILFPDGIRIENAPLKVIEEIIIREMNELQNK